MPEFPFPTLWPGPTAEALRLYIDARSWRRIRQLRVEFEDNRVVVRGVVSSYYFKQLALSGLRDLLPEAPVDLAIEVRPEQPAFVDEGMPRRHAQALSPDSRLVSW
jgi:hypothetical protein